MALFLGVGLWFGCAAAAAASIADLKGLADPTRPYTAGTGPTVTTPTPEVTGPVLQSTMISPTGRRAVISGRTYHVGEKIGGAVITDIQPYEVTLKRGDRETRLRLFPRLVKEPKPSSGKASGKGG